MVQLVDSDIQTREVLDWKGLHLLHHPAAACSKKVRIFLNVKGIDWESHIVDITSGENYSEWFLGVNPRGLIPVLVDDGVVHIESNDILMYLESKFSGSAPGPDLIPAGGESDMELRLKHENSLHMDLRTLVFRFYFPGKSPSKPEGALEKYRDTGSGTVGGAKDQEKSVQIDFWETVSREGITDEAARKSALKFRAAFDELEARLEDNPYLLGDALSILDVAWFIYTDRLILAGYPISRLHPLIDQWFNKLSERPEFSKEVVMPDPMKEMIATAQSEQEKAGKTLSLIAGF